MEPACKILTPDPHGWVCAGPVSLCPIGKAIAVALENFGIAIFHLPDGWFAVKDACPHAEFPLSHGAIRDRVVTCTSHSWQFRVDTGECLKGDPSVTIRTFPVKESGGKIWIKAK